jgi:hypothetical protein
MSGSDVGFPVRRGVVRVRVVHRVCPVAAAASAPARAARLDQMAGACSTGPAILTAPGANTQAQLQVVQY